MSARHRARRLPAPAVVAAAWLAGSVPFSNIAARRVARVDLRGVGHGTVSGTALYEVAGFRPLAVAGVCEVAKGAVGPVLAGRDRPGLGALAATAAVAGHNWSPWLGGAGGRGVSVALGAFLPLAWPGTVALALGLAGGRLARQTGLGTLIGAAATVPLVRRTHGRAAAAGAAGIVGVMVAKRLAGNRPADPRAAHTYLHRLLFDSDPPGPGAPAGGGQRERRAAAGAAAREPGRAPAASARAGAGPDGGAAPAGEGRP
ncbi:MAG TPA: glycerol-3-phosphate acyltransferase [Acidimicrobiales bacterium]|nr:glycerol-3-phosphate acyltransferase [Acidimicrobiales bacterium]